jgi:hypothetical protein
MTRTGVFFSVSFTLATTLSVLACSSGDVAVGTSSQALKKTPGGNPTGDGKTCSWNDSVGYDVATGKTTTTPAKDGEYKVGDSFPSTDGCNQCSCTDQGIACTLIACAPPPGGGACPALAMQCPDGSYAGATGPNCEFVCPTPQACTEEAKQCPDGSAVGRTGPKCEFAPCPSDVVCTADAKQCPDGSYVSRTGPSCQFAPCP